MTEPAKRIRAAQALCRANLPPAYWLRKLIADYRSTCADPAHPHGWNGHLNPCSPTYIRNKHPLTASSVCQGQTSVCAKEMASAIPWRLACLAGLLPKTENLSGSNRCHFPDSVSLLTSGCQMSRGKTCRPHRSPAPQRAKVFCAPGVPLHGKILAWITSTTWPSQRAL